MSQYRKKPVVVEAVQFTQEMGEAWVLDRVPLPDGMRCDRSNHNHNTRTVHSASFSILTLEGRMRVEVGDWIITGVTGKKYQCKPDIFAMTYEPAPPTPPPQPAPTPAVDVEAIKRRCDAATPGPWRAAGGYVTVRDPDSGSFRMSIYHLDELGHGQKFQAVPYARGEDAQFVAAARTDVPLLLAEIARLRAAPTDEELTAAVRSDIAAELDKYAEHLDDIDDWGHCDHVRALAEKARR